MKQADLHTFAALGAQARIAEIQREIDAIRKRFPAAGGRPGASVAASAAAPARKPRNMSAAARERISKAAKRRWALWRKEKAKAS